MRIGGKGRGDNTCVLQILLILIRVRVCMGVLSKQPSLSLKEIARFVHVGLPLEDTQITRRCLYCSKLHLWRRMRRPKKKNKKKRAIAQIYDVGCTLQRRNGEGGGG